MKKKYSFKILFTTLTILTGIYLATFLYGRNLLNKSKIEGNSTLQEKKVCIYKQSGDICFEVDIPDTKEKKRKGLMFVKQLPLQKGMLFTYEVEGNYAFWMKNTLIPLDMIRIDKNKHIVDIQTAQPCKADPCKVYIPKGKAQYILEINAGESKKNSIYTGDTIVIKDI